MLQEELEAGHNFWATSLVNTETGMLYCFYNFTKQFGLVIYVLELNNNSKYIYNETLKIKHAVVFSHSELVTKDIVTIFAIHKRT